MRYACAVLLLSTTIATGCGAAGQEGGPASRFERQLKTMAGVADARVEREAFDTDYWGEEIVVDMDVESTAEEIAAVLDAFLARARETDGAPQDAHLTIGAGTTNTEGDRFAPDAPPLAVPAERPAGNARIARVLVTAVAAFPGHYVGVTSDHWSVIGAAEGTDPRPEMDRMIAAVEADELLATTEEFNLTAVTGPDNEGRTISLHADDGLPPELVSIWQRLAPSMDGPGVRGLSFSPTSINLFVRAGENVKPRQLTTEAYGDVLWPTLHAALDTLVTMPRVARLAVTNEYDVNENGGGYLEDRFLVTRPQLRTGRDRLGRTWNEEAAAYLLQITAARSDG